MSDTSATTDNGATPAHLPTGGRGTLTMDAAIVAKIAAQAAAELLDIGAPPGGALGLGTRKNFAGLPDASADVYGDTAVITLDLAVVYPRPLRAIAERIRTHVRSRVGELTGLTVDHVNVTISWLRAATTTRQALT